MRVIFIALIMLTAGRADGQEEQIGHNGLVHAHRVARLSTEIAGRVIKRHRNDSDEVKAGSLLLSLDDTLARSAMRAAEAQLKKAGADHVLAKRELERARRLGRVDAASKAALDRAIAKEQLAAAAVQGAEANLASRKYELERTRIVAPFDGAILRFAVEEGEYLLPGTPLCEVVELRRVKIESFLSESEVRKIRKADKVLITTTEGRSLPGSVTSVAPAASPKTRAFRVVIAAENPASKQEIRPLAPGLTVRWRRIVE